ncbi:MAG: hypothetical protein H7259_07505, partial [Cytophagales bacterium]|nr:hypothetical protein [Cytophaga sp.]
MRPNQFFSSKNLIKLRSVEFVQYIGYTKFDDVIFTSLADINIGVGRKGSVQIKLPYTLVSGALGNTNGIGDISYAYTRSLITKPTYQLLTTLGGKIPTNNSDKLSSDGLPMYYQTSLGTYDIVAGLSFITRNWLFAAGYQQPFNQNKSEFRWSQWKGDEQFSTASQYPPSWNLKRGNDVMFRIERNFRSTKWNGYIGLLNIYRLNEDVINKTQDIRAQVPNTTGFAITALFGAGYRFSTNTAVKGMFGQKIINRETNPDGLSRE